MTKTDMHWIKITKSQRFA